MQRFPINWALKSVVADTALELNDTGTLECVWNANQFGYLNPHFIKIRRKYSVEEILIFGEFLLSGSITIRASGIVESKRKFSELMRGESLSVEIKFHDPQDPISFCNADFSLHGETNIISFHEIRIDDFVNDKCRLPEESLELLSNEFESLLERETCLSDVTLKCGNASIPAHKNILSARSPVFAAMFKNPMKENLENEVDIDDVDEHILRIMLTYIYAGKISDMTVLSASGLLAAADKYQLQDLKNMCCEFLESNICLENVVRILVLGDMHAKYLKLLAMEYISHCTQFSVLEELEEWKALLQERPAWAIEVLTILVKARDRNMRIIPSKHE